MGIAPVTDAQVYTAFAVTFWQVWLPSWVGIGAILEKPNYRVLAFGLAFAAGAMIYVSLTEILNKSISSFSLAFDEKSGFAYGTFAFYWVWYWSYCWIDSFLIRMKPLRHNRNRI